MSSRATAARKRPAQQAQSLSSTKPPWLRSESFILGCVLFVATLSVYLPAGGHPFFDFDDPVYVVHNAHIATGLHWETVAWAFSTFYQCNWHPLTWLSHAVDVELFQLAPGGHHVMNMLLATAVAMDPQSIRGWLGLGVVAEKTGDLRAAIDYFKRANMVRPLRVTYQLLAKAREEAGDMSGAETAREQARLLPQDEQTTQTYSGGILQH